MTACKKPLCAILAFVLVFVFIAAAPISVFAEEGEELTFSQSEIDTNKKFDEDSGLYYLQTADDPSSLQIVGYDEKNPAKEIKVPATIDSLTVVAIGANAFKDNKVVEKIAQRYNCEVSNENSYNQVVISGLKEDIEKASNECIKKRS